MNWGMSHISVKDEAMLYDAMQSRRLSWAMIYEANQGLGPGWTVFRICDLKGCTA